jgi:hypothetical protein
MTRIAIGQLALSHVSDRVQIFTLVLLTMVNSLHRRCTAALEVNPIQSADDDQEKCTHLARLHLAHQYYLARNEYYFQFRSAVYCSRSRPVVQFQVSSAARQNHHWRRPLYIHTTRHTYDCDRALVRVGIPGYIYIYS